VDLPVVGGSIGATWSPLMTRIVGHRRARASGHRTATPGDEGTLLQPTADDVPTRRMT
jgi:hypothetical protein